MAFEQSGWRLAAWSRWTVLGCALALAAVVNAAGQVDEVPAETAAAPAVAEATADPASGGAIITPTDENKPALRVRTGPSVEMITGGNSADGTARVGRLPVLE